MSKLSERVNKLLKRCVTIGGVAEAWWIRTAYALHAAPTGGFFKKTGLILAINHSRDFVKTGILISLFIDREIADTSG